MTRPRRDGKHGKWQDGVRQKPNGLWEAKAGNTFLKAGTTGHGYETKAEARSARERLTHERQREQNKAREVTVQEWVEEFLSAHQAGNVESTRLWYAERLSALQRDFGGRRLSGLSKQDAYDWIVGAGAFQGDPHRSHLRPVKIALQAAVRHGVDGLVENPFGDIKEQRSRGRSEITVLTLEELELLREVTLEERREFGERMFWPLLECLAWTGIRPGEAYALKESAIDFKAGELHVDWQVSSKTRKLTRPKGGRTRVVPLLPSAKRALRLALRYGSGFVFCAPRGGMLYQERVRKLWTPVATAFAERLPSDHWLNRRGDGLDVYELRHFFGSQLAERGVSAYDIADAMGHRDGGRLAYERYVHVEPSNSRRRIREAFE